MALDEVELRRLGQKWCDLGEPRRKRLLQILEGTLKLDDCPEQMRPRIQSFLSELHDHGTSETPESLLEVVKDRARRVAATNKSRVG